MKQLQAVAGSEDYQARIDEVQDKLQDYLEKPRLAQSPEELEILERALPDAE